MLRRLTDLAKGLTGLTATLALLAGVPIALATIIGWPLPTETPDWDLARRHITDADIPDAFVIKTLAVIVWLAWAQLAIAILIEFQAALRGRIARRAPVLPGIQLFAAKLATWTTLITATLSPARPALAAPLQALTAEPAAVQPVDMLTDAVASPTLHLTIDTATGDVVDADTAPGTYLTVEGDSWWRIAEQLLDDGLRWQEIRDLNVGRQTPTGETIDATTDTVRPGWDLLAPPDANPTLLNADQPNTTTADATSSTSDNAEDADLVTVVEGDHFWKIAKDVLTDAWGRPPTDAEMTPYWAELVEHNEGRLAPPGDPDLIYPAQQFEIPPPPPSPDVAHDVQGTAVRPTEPQELTPPRLPVEPTSAPASEPEAAPSAESVTPAPAETTPVPAVEEPAERAAPATAPVTTPASTNGAASSVTDRVLDVAKPVAATAAGLGLLAGLTLATLRRLRHIQAARRRPGTTLEGPDTTAERFEQRIRAIATDGEDVRYITATNTFLAHQLHGHPTAAIPSVVAMRAGQYGLEILLDDPCEPVDGFIADTNDHLSWRLHPDTTARMMEAEAIDAHPFCPALLVVGSTDAGDLLVDFEQLGTVALEGDNHDTTAFQRGLIASALAAPWADQCRIVTLGIDGLSNDALSRVETPDNPTEWATDTVTEHNAIASTLTRSPYEQRVNHGEVYHPTLVFIGTGDEHAAVAQHLAPAASLAYSPLVMISAAPIVADYRIPIDADTGTLEPLGATFRPVRLQAADLAATDALLAKASDTTTSPPTDQWATETTDEPEIIDLDSPQDEDHAATPADPTEDGDGEPPPPGDPVEPSVSIADEIERIMAPRPIEVTLLGRSPTIEGTTNAPSPKLEAIICYLAYHREVASQRLREEFWPANTRRQAADNAIGKVRTLLGRTSEGQPRLESAINSGTYTLSDEVGCDWHRVKQLLTLAKHAGTPEGEAAALDAICELIEGRVGVDAPPANYGWLLNDSGVYTNIETTLVDAAHRRGELALATDNVERANWAARKGLHVVEGQEALYRIQMRAAAQRGDTEAVKAAYREAQRAAESYGYDEEVQPETQALYASLTGRSSSESVGRG